MINILKLLPILLSEFFTSKGVDRQPEPDLVMNNKENALIFFQQGHLNTPLGMSYLLYAAHACQIICENDVVIDLGCGSGQFLTLMAELNPNSHFIGVDLSEPMLKLASELIMNKGLKNVELKKLDLSNLSEFKDQSVDAVISTLTMHHLPSINILELYFKELRRVVKTEGGIFLTDYGRFKSTKSMNFFANKYNKIQNSILTLDYLNSLKAAFSIQELETICKKYLDHRVQITSTKFLPLMVFIKSRPRRQTNSDSYKIYLNQRKKELNTLLQKDFDDLVRFCRFGGANDNVFK